MHITKYIYFIFIISTFINIISLIYNIKINIKYIYTSQTIKYKTLIVTPTFL